MTLYNPEGQTNPVEEVDFEVAEFKRAVGKVVAALDDSRPSIIAWFWRGLFAFNLVLWSIALPIAALILLP